MKRITPDEAAEYAAWRPRGDRLNRDDFVLRGFALLLTIVCCCLWRTGCILAVIVSVFVCAAALITSSKTIVNKRIKGPYTLLSDSFTFLACSVNLAMMTAYFILNMSGNMALGFIVSFGINAIEMIMLAIYARGMIHKKSYKSEKTSFPVGPALAMGGAGLGWIFAQQIFADATEDEQMSMLAGVTMLGGMLMNFGLIGFLKYYCCVIALKREHH